MTNIAERGGSSRRSFLNPKEWGKIATQSGAKAMQPVIGPLQEVAADLSSVLSSPDASLSRNSGSLPSGGNVGETVSNTISRNGSIEGLKVPKNEAEVSDSEGSAFGESTISIYMASGHDNRSLDQVNNIPPTATPPGEGTNDSVQNKNVGLLAGGALGLTAGYYIGGRLFKRTASDNLPNSRRKILRKAVIGLFGTFGAGLGSAVDATGVTSMGSPRVNRPAVRPVNNAPIEPESTPIVQVPEEDYAVLSIQASGSLNESQKKDMDIDFVAFDRRVSRNARGRKLRLVPVETNSTNNSITGDTVQAFYFPQRREIRAIARAMGAPKLGEPGVSDRKLVNQIVGVLHDGTFVQLPNPNVELNENGILTWGFDNNGDFAVYDIFRNLRATWTPSLFGGEFKRTQEQSRPATTVAQQTVIETPAPVLVATKMPTPTSVPPSPTDRPPTAVPSPTEAPLSSFDRLKRAGYQIEGVMEAPGGVLLMVGGRDGFPGGENSVAARYFDHINRMFRERPDLYDAIFMATGVQVLGKNTSPNGTIDIERGFRTSLVSAERALNAGYSEGLMGYLDVTFAHENRHLWQFVEKKVQLDNRGCMIGSGFYSPFHEMDAVIHAEKIFQLGANFYSEAERIAGNAGLALQRGSYESNEAKCI